MQITHTYYIDIGTMYNKIPQINIKQADVNSHKLLINLFYSGQALNLTGNTVKIYFLKSDYTEVFQSCTIEDYTNGIVSCVLSSNTIAAIGDLLCEVSIYGSDNTVLSSITFTINEVKLQANSIQTTANNALPSSSYTASDVLTKLLTVDTDTSGLNSNTLQQHPASDFLITTGSGSNGNYLKFPDGTIKQWGSIVTTSSGTNGTNGIVNYKTITGLTLPTAFTTTTYKVIVSTNQAPCWGYGAPSTTSSINIGCANPVSGNNEGVTLYWEAIGK